MSEKKFLSAEWRNLIMYNYEVAPQVLQKYIPKGTELDFWQGKTYVSLVAFMFLNTKVLGIPVPFHRNFEEVNLRFYVRYKAQDEWRRGVVFIKEIVPKRAIASIANIVYGEHYIRLPMKHEIEETDTHLNLSYSWKFNGAWHQAKASCSKPAKPMLEGSEAEFIAEHYWGYTQQKNGSTSEYRVEHPAWDVYDVESYDLKCNVGELYGQEFTPFMQGEASSVFVAKGSEIIVRQHKRTTI
ncbi:MAG: DUF2071 domain-containing protein [Saprospiraceae bacterium]|nr:DUF2071 domain-containing protein [Saprospiraceae bacterium]